MTYLKKALLLIAIVCSSSIAVNAQSYTLTVDNKTCAVIDMDIVLAVPGTTTRCIPTSSYYYSAPPGITSQVLPGNLFIYFLHPFELANPTNFTTAPIYTDFCLGLSSPQTANFPMPLGCQPVGPPPMATLHTIGSGFFLEITP